MEIDSSAISGRVLMKGASDHHSSANQAAQVNHLK
jgi:hypothetical protein